MEYLLKAAAITALFYLCYTLFLKRDTFFESNRWFLLIGLLATICLPLIIIPIYIEQTTTTVTGQSINIAASSLGSTTESSFNYTKLIIWIYGLGTTLFFAKLLLEFSSLFILLRSNISKKVGPYTFIETQKAISPFSFFNYIVYNPNQFNAEELELIIKHEKVHVDQKHSVDILLVQLVTVIFWFNPFIWLYKKDLQQNLEFIADYNAQRKSLCERSYQELLLKTSITNHQLVLANNFYNSLIKKRIVMLHKSKSNKLNLLKFLLVLPLVALFLMSFNTKNVYLDANPTLKSETTFGDIEMVMITKDFTDSDFEKVKKEFANKGITLKFKGIKRNSNGEIIAIKIEAKSKKSNASYNINADEGIKPIKITFDEDSDAISIGNVGEHHFGGHNSMYFTSKDGEHKIVKSGQGSNVYVFSEGEHEEHEEHEEREEHEEHDVEIIVKGKDGKKHKNKRVIVKDSNVFHLDSDDGETEKVYIVKESKDGKKVKEEIIVKGHSNVEWHSDDESDHEVNVFKTKGGNVMYYSGDGNEKPLVYINGKASTFEEMQKLGTSIKYMEVLKGDKAIKKYGKKAKDGVLLITTKK